MRKKNLGEPFTPCYKSKIQYHQNKINSLVNCSPSEIDPKLLLRHLESLTHFVKKQAEIQSINSAIYA
jgi:hypothetical protein